MANKSFPLPIQGVNYGMPVDKTPPTHSGYMNNVRVKDTLENRIRIGSRPGLKKAYSQQIGGADSPIKGMGSITKTRGGGTSLYQSYASNDNSSTVVYGTNWAAQTFLPVATFDISKVTLKLYKTGTPGNLSVSIKATDSTTYKPTGSDLSTGTYNGNTLGASPGAFVDVTMTSATLVAGTLYAIVCRALTGSAGNDVQWRKDSLNNGYTSGALVTSNNSGTSWGDLSALGDCMFKVYGTPPASQIVVKQLVAAGNNEYWYESLPNTMTELTDANGNIDTSKGYSMFGGFQKSFIANDTNLKVVDFINTKLTLDAAIATAPDRGSIVTQLNSGATMVVDFVDSTIQYVYGFTTNGTFTTNAADTLSGGSMTAGSYPTAVAEASSTPHFYTWAIYPKGNVGTMPSQATIGCLYRGRGVLAGDTDYPHQWYMSKVSDLFNWYYDSTDPLTAVRGGNADAGEIGDIITALIPYKDDYLVFGCSNSIWLMMGDPASGGQLAEFSLTTGIWGQKAWCFDDSNNLYFFGLNGLYKASITGQGVSPPVNISSIVLPNWISDWAVDDALHEITVEYDPIRKGILISRTVIATGVAIAYWYDLNTEGFFPESYPADCGIHSTYYYTATDGSYRKVLYGCDDGYIREFDNDTKSDSATADTAISSHVALPIERMSEDMDKEGKLTSLTFDLAGGASSGDFSDTDNVRYSLYAADDAETCLEDIIDTAAVFSTAAITGTLSGTGRKARVRQKFRGNSLGIVMSNSTISTAWAINNIYGNIKEAGRIR